MRSDNKKRPAIPKSWRRDKAYLEARRKLREACTILRRGGRTWPQVEAQLKMFWGNGMTAWRAAGNKHKPNAFKAVKRKVRSA